MHYIVRETHSYAFIDFNNDLCAIMINKTPQKSFVVKYSNNKHHTIKINYYESPNYNDMDK